MMKSLKSTIYTFVLAALAVVCKAQERPQKVVSVVEERHEIAWYEKQATLWKQALYKNPKDENGWLYYYTAVRMQWLEEGKNDSTLNKRLTQIVAQAVKAVPGSFVANYLQGRNTGSPDTDAFAFIKKAYEKDPTNPLTYDELVTHYEVTQDLAPRREINQKWLASGTYSPGILAYNYNVLSTLSQDAIIITGGDNDTYPLWMLQDGLNYRPDVTVINTSLIRIEAYRAKILAKLGITLTEEQRKSLSPGNYTPEDISRFESSLFDVLTTNARGRQVYFALTLGTPPSVAALEAKLYLVGLASLYATEKIDNLALLRANFEKNYLLDYLTAPLYKETAKTVVPLFAGSYLAPLILLYNHYKASGEQERSQRLRVLLLTTAKASGQEAEVLPLIKG